MYLETMMEQARRMSRTTVASHTDEVVKDYINYGQQEFSKDCKGLWAQDWLTVSPKFWLRSHFAIAIETNEGSASFTFATTSYDAIDGASVAALLSTSIQTTWSSSTVVWSSSNWTFTIENPSASWFNLFAPQAGTVIDFSTKLFGSTVESASASFTGGFPEDCNIDTSCPTGFLNMEYVEWDDSPLDPAPFDLFISPNSSGTPQYWQVREKTVKLYPVPDEQGLFHIWYRKLPTDFGAVSVTGSGSLSATCALDSEYQLGPVYYAASLLADDNYEDARADRLYARYKMSVNKYIQQHHNQHPEMFPKEIATVNYKVIF